MGLDRCSKKELELKAIGYNTKSDIEAISKVITDFLLSFQAGSLL